MNVKIEGKIDRCQELHLDSGEVVIRLHVMFPATDAFEQPPVVEVRAKTKRTVGEMVSIPCRLVGFRRARYKGRDDRPVYPVDNILVET
jgi:hypothetical protein